MSDTPCQDFDSLRFLGLQSSYTTFILGLVQLMALLLLVAWQQIHQHRARKGKIEASKLMVSPSYVWILMAYGVTSAIIGVLNVFFEIKKYPEIDSNPIAPSIVMGMAWGAYHMVLDGLAFFLCMNGSGWIALKRSFRYSIGVFVLLSTLQCLTNLWHQWAPNDDIAWGLAMKLASEIILFIPYLCLVILPHNVLHRRPAAVFYAGFWIVYRPLYMILIILLYYQVDFVFCIYLPLTVIVYGFMIPALIVKTLREDAKYWQGIITESIVDNGAFQRHKNRDQKLSSNNSKRLSWKSWVCCSPSYAEAEMRTPLLGTAFEYDTAQTLAGEMDALDGTLNITVISFAHLKLTETNTSFAVLGAGGTARVFRGTYKDEKVAIKMLYCMTLTPDTVHNFFQESTLLCRLQHPNIVHVSGVCVLPPAICMVMELCNGSLYEYLRLNSTTENLDWEDRLNLAIECVSGVACLHEQKPPILHMDLKSPNFLLGEQLVPKWTSKDVQTWLTTMQLVEFKRVFRYHNIDGSELIRHDAKSLEKLVGKELSVSKQFGNLVDAVSDISTAVKRRSKHGVVKLTDLELSQEDEDDDEQPSKPQEIEIPQTVNWTAPEVISGGKAKFSTAADVYSLAMVLWELLTGRVPFDEEGILTTDVASLVLKDQRPPIPDDTPLQFTQLIEKAWHKNVLERPSATEMKKTLILMRRRYLTNRTLERGKFLEEDDETSKQKISASTFQENRFAAAQERLQLSSASGFSMGSLSNIDAIVEATSDTKQFETLNRQRSGHTRTKSLGSIKSSVIQTETNFDTCVDDFDQQYT